MRELVGVVLKSLGIIWVLFDISWKLHSIICMQAVRPLFGFSEAAIPSGVLAIQHAKPNRCEMPQTARRPSSSAVGGTRIVYKSRQTGHLWWSFMDVRGGLCGMKSWMYRLLDWPPHPAYPWHLVRPFLHQHPGSLQPRAARAELRLGPGLVPGSGGPSSGFRWMV